MATISASTQAAPLAYPHASMIDRRVQDGALYCMLKNSAGNFELFRSLNGGATWTTLITVVRANVQELCTFLIDWDGLGYFAFRTYESGQDRIYTARFNITSSPGYGGEVLLAAAAAASAGAVYSGMDIQKVLGPSGVCLVVVAVGTNSGGMHGVTLMGETITAAAVPSATNTFLINRRQWLTAGSGRIAPSLDIEHGGDGKTGSPAHLWCAWGRTSLHMVKLAWTGSGWTGPTTAQTIISSGLTAMDSLSARWDGQCWLMCVPDASTVRVIERNRANSSEIVRNTPAHPAGVVRQCTMSYNNVTRDVRVYAVGTSTAVLHYVDFIRATGVWSGWSEVLATAVIGSGSQFSVRRTSYGNARNDVVTCHSTPAQISTAQTLAYAPFQPAWQFGATANTPASSGAAMDVALPLTLAWTFADPDPGDTQQSYSLSRQVGAAAVEYWRASDSTWQAAEQVNTSGTTQLTLSATQWSTDGAAGGAGDPPHTYKVKVRDAGGVASIYSDGLVVVASAKVNPSITSPTAAQVMADSAVPITWTVAGQTKYRLRLRNTADPAGPYLWDSGLETTAAATATPAVALADGGNYTVELQTANLEGLLSDVVTRQFTIDYVEPPAAAVAPNPIPASGLIRVAITNPAPAGAQPALLSQDLYRRQVRSANLLANPGFAADAAGWFTVGATSLTRSNAQSHSGGWSGRLIPDGIGTDAYAEADSQIIDPSQSYTAEGWIRADTAAKPVRVYLLWYTAAGAFVSSVTATVTPPVAGAWMFVTVTGAPPPTAGKAGVGLGVGSSPSAADAAYVDDATLKPANADLGVPVAAALASGATYDDWLGTASGVPYEYRIQAKGVNGAVGWGSWTA